MQLSAPHLTQERISFRNRSKIMNKIRHETLPSLVAHLCGPSKEVSSIDFFSSVPVVVIVLHVVSASSFSARAGWVVL